MVLIDLKTGELAREPIEAPLVLENDANDKTRQKIAAEAQSDGRAIAIPFPKFSDGRGFSLAAVLRRHDGFAGELRVVGHVIPDQALHLMRAGFDTVAVSEEIDLATWQSALRRYRGGYQTASCNPFALRRDHVATGAPQRNANDRAPSATHVAVQRQTTPAP